MSRVSWIAVAALGALLAQGDPATAQDADAPTAAEAAEPAGLTEDELDDLVAPVALYPDALLTQVLVGATYPLDVVKAQRWTEGAGDLAPDARADAAQAEGWDPSVAVLAAGFPTVIARMAEDLDWTQALGDAVLAQSDDVLDAVQRQRSRAAATGWLSDNAAQTVVEEDGAIAIVPADPDVVYVPSYDPALAYSQPPAAAPVIADPLAPAAVAPADEGFSTGSLIATGALSFGAGLLVNELFDDDDDDWDDYWRGPPPVRWGDGDFYPRPGRGGVAVGGDVNIDVDRGPRPGAGRPGAWRPDEARRDKARRDLAQRREGRPGGDRAQPAALRPSGDRAQGADRAALQDKLKARGDGAAKPKRPAAASAERKPLAKKPAGNPAALKKPAGGGLTAAKKERERGVASKKLGGDRKAAVKRPAAKPQKAKLERKPAGRPVAMKKDRGGGGGAKAAKQRAGGKKLKRG